MESLPVEVVSKIFAHLVKDPQQHGIGELETIRRLTEVWPWIGKVVVYKPTTIRTLEILNDQFFVDGLRLTDEEQRYLPYFHPEMIRIKEMPTVDLLASTKYKETLRKVSTNCKQIIFEHFHHSIDSIEQRELIISSLHPNPFNHCHREIHFRTNPELSIIDAYTHLFHHIHFETLQIDHHNFSYIIWCFMVSPILKTIRFPPIFFLPFNLFTHLHDSDGKRLSDFSLFKNETSTAFLLRADQKDWGWLFYNSKLTHPQFEYQNFPKNFQIFAKVFIEIDHVIFVKSDEKCCRDMPKASFSQEYL
ncbi:unnamed protein product, partial [Mesorhabditis belari]|uniref:F-box domain-containing protein n=1 Tax=Mesorhabditis belari TaxID=2138241 RepID=A0AAF3EDJ8_9BILA